MPDPSHSNLLLRIRPSKPETPNVFPVEATLDGTGSLLATIEIASGLFSDESNPWEYGRRLGECVFADANLRRFLAYARGPAGNRVSLTLQIDAEAAVAHDLLWERLIYLYGQEEEALAASSRFALSRIVPSEDPTSPPPGEGPFRLLLVIASPSELHENEGGTLKPIDVAAEIQSLRAIWDPLVQRGLLRVTVLARVDDETRRAMEAAAYRVSQTPATLNALSDALSSFDSLHLICHGSFKKRRASLLLEDPDGRSAIVGEEEFLAKLGNRSLRLVFLQACQSARRERGEPNVFSGLAPKIVRHAGAVIAMQDFVRMEEASRFAQEFYETLLATGSAAQAASAGRLTLRRPDSGSWAIPALYLAPNAEPLWQPDAILAASQDLAARFREQQNLAIHFPIEVIRHNPGESVKMETSPPGPRVPVFEAVEQVLLADGEQRFGVAILAGNSGRGKTSQLYNLYTRYAAKVSAGGPIPLFVRVCDFEVSDVPAVQAVARAIGKAYLAEAELILSVQLLAKRLSQSFILFVDGDRETYTRKRSYAFQMIAELLQERTDASVVITLDEASMPEAALFGPEGSGNARVTILLTQLLSRAAVGQYLCSVHGAEGKRLLGAIQHSNLFDIACVPWLLNSLIKQSNRAILSRSGVIARVINGNLAEINWSPGARRIVSEFLERIAWTLQTYQVERLAGNRLYDVLNEVRGRREIPLDQIRALALDTKILCPSEDDGVRFAYPGFQSFWCAQYLLDTESSLGRHLDDITATLGRRSRVRLWEDTLVLLAGLMESPDRLVRRILAGSSLSQGEQTFLAATCIHEARLSGKSIAPDVAAQVYDNLVWRSTSSRERRYRMRVRAVECLGMLHDATSIPHLLSLALDPVRMAGDGTLTYELSGLRQSAVEVLLTMQSEVEKYIELALERSDARPGLRYLPGLIEAWREGDSSSLQRTFRETKDGIPAIAAFVLASLGGERNLDFLIEQAMVPGTPNDTLWAIADALLLFSPAEVSRRAIRRMREQPELLPVAAYLVGKLRVTVPGDEDFALLEACLQSEHYRTRTRAMRALALVGDSRHRRLCEYLATAQWDLAEAESSVPLPADTYQRTSLRYHAIESLRLIGTMESIAALRAARLGIAESSPCDPEYGDFIELSYEVSEEIYWRLTGGLDGDSYDPLPAQDPNS